MKNLVLLRLGIQNGVGKGRFRIIGMAVALFNKCGHLSYIGIGISKSSHPLVNRLISHVLEKKPGSENEYQAQKKWSDVAFLATIGFNKNQDYLAAALETYLIKKLNPPRNKKGKT